jgi:hypothetical protein
LFLGPAAVLLISIKKNPDPNFEDHAIENTPIIFFGLINCQYFCTSSSLIYDPKVDGYVFLIVPV